MTGRLDSEVIIIGGGATGAVSPATAPGADYERCSLSEYARNQTITLLIVAKWR